MGRGGGRKRKKTPSSTPPPALPLLASYYGLKPDIKVISPWREWDLNSRTKLIAYAEAAGIPVPASKRGEPPFSMDANLLHISYEGNALEDPWAEPSESMFTRSVSPENAPDVATYVEIEFEKGDPVALDGVRMSPATLLTELNKVRERGGEGGKKRRRENASPRPTHPPPPPPPPPPSTPRSRAPTASAASTSLNPGSSA